MDDITSFDEEDEDDQDSNQTPIINRTPALDIELSNEHKYMNI